MSGRRLAGFLFVAVVAASLAGCGGKSNKPVFGPGLGQSTADRRSIDEARADLTAPESEAVAVVRAALDLERAGGTLTSAERERLIDAAESLAAGVLAELLGDVDGSSGSGRKVAASVVALRLALVSAHQGDSDAARTWVARVGDGDPALSSRAAALRVRLAVTSAKPGLLAVALPLSGRHSGLGVEILRAVEMAASDVRGVKVLRLDTKGTPEGAAAAAQKAHDKGAVAIVGPVGEIESRAAAARAAQLGVPIAVLAPDEGGAAPAAGIYRLSTSAVWEAREAARLAALLGHDTVAVLAPRDGVGKRQAEAFAAAATKQGAVSVRIGYYDPSATDLEPDMREFLGLDPKTNARLRRHLRKHGRKNGWKSFSPDVDFDLLFIPDDYQRAALVASYLPYFNVELRAGALVDTLGLRRKHGGRLPSVVQLLGGAGWHHPGLIPRGGKAVDGALVMDVYSGGGTEEFPSERAAEFARRFSQRTRRSPSVVAAKAYDAGTLAARAVAAAGKGSEARKKFGPALRAIKLVDGVCGPTMVDARGQILRDPLLLRVDLDEFILHDM